MAQAAFWVAYAQHIGTHIAHVVLHSNGQFNDALILGQHQRPGGVLTLFGNVLNEHLSDQARIPAQAFVLNFFKGAKLKDHSALLRIHHIKARQQIDNGNDDQAQPKHRNGAAGAAGIAVAAIAPTGATANHTGETVAYFFPRFNQTRRAAVAAPSAPGMLAPASWLIPGHKMYSA